MKKACKESQQKESELADRFNESLQPSASDSNALLCADGSEEFIPDDELSVLRQEYQACHALLDEHNVKDTHVSGEAYSLYGRLHVLLGDGT